MQAWEYCIFTAYESSEQTQYTLSYTGQVKHPKAKSRLDVLADLGEQGWELVAVHSLAPGLKEFYFKRPT